MNRRFHEDYPITALLLMVVIGFFVLEIVAIQKLGEPGSFDIIFFSGAGQTLELLGSLDTEAVVRDRQIWRLLSCTALHAGLIHLFFNASVLLSLGRLCEPLISSPKFFTFYVLCGLGGSLARLGVSHLTGSPVLSLGASGALMGLIGVLLTHSITQRRYELRQAITSWIIQIAIMSVIAYRVLDHTAHVGGFVTGCLLGLTVKQYTRSDTVERWKIPAWTAGVAYGAALVFALYNYFSFLWTNG